MINTQANERFVVISEFGSQTTALYIAAVEPVHMSSPRQQSVCLARQPASQPANQPASQQLSTTPPPPPPLYNIELLSAVLLYTARCTRSPPKYIIYYTEPPLLNIYNNSTARIPRYTTPIHGKYQYIITTVYRGAVACIVIWTVPAAEGSSY